MLALFSKTSDSPECHGNLSEFEPSQATGRRLCLDLSWWHKLTHTIETTNVGEYVYVYSCLVNSSLFSMSDLKWRPIHELLLHYVQMKGRVLLSVKALLHLTNVTGLSA